MLYLLMVKKAKFCSSNPNGFGENSEYFLPPLAAIERIEVIRGIHGTLYGSDAMGGL